MMPSRPSDRWRWLPGLLKAAVVIFFVAGVARYADSTTGLSSLLRFGEAFAERRLPALADVPLATARGDGYDGQFYAQLAVNPDVRDPAVQHALDNPPYRARRILLPWLAHVAGFGSAHRAVQAYAAMNLVAWTALGWLLHRRTAAQGVRGALVWCAAMLASGTLESVRLGLVDLPATVLWLVAALFWPDPRRQRAFTAGAWLAAAALSRETFAAAITMFGAARNAAEPRWRQRSLAALLALAPLGGWLIYVHLQVPRGDAGAVGNFDWPGVAIARHLYHCTSELAGDDARWRHVFGPLAIVALVYQSYVVLRASVREATPMLLGAAPFAILLWLLGDKVWEGYTAVTRNCLPLTLAYLLWLPRDRHFWWRWIVANLALPHALLQFWSEAG
ncbi:MAG TPA: hypothetical protein VHF69_12305 [Candidatus Synoicihabitans sp.]|nr:hypothetical protein [Candidatus Synoicihabitans sp.]